MNKIDGYEFMELAIEEAKKDTRPFKVGAVVVKNGKQLGKICGAYISNDEHAEYALLERLLPQKDVRGATLYTTLEPCTKTYHSMNPRKTCAEIIKERGITKVVIGIRDPNPDIFNAGVRTLLKNGIEVSFFPKDLSKKIENICKGWIKDQKNKRKADYNALFSILEKNRKENIFNFPRFVVNDNLTLRLCPNITQGWLLSNIKLNYETDMFTLPKEYKAAYNKYKKTSKKHLGEDNPKIMLRETPHSFTDDSCLTLNAEETIYSQVQFYKDKIANQEEKKQSLIARCVEDHKIEFPHALCFHIIVVTRDKKILITRRSPDVTYFPKTWSFSIEENMAKEDFKGGHKNAFMNFAKRALLEELGLTENEYNLRENFRILSVFLESKILNISFCGHVVLNITSTELDKIIKAVPRPDDEFTAASFLDYKDLIPQILTPSLPYHPTAQYRMVMALLKSRGLPSDAARFL